MRVVLFTLLVTQTLLLGASNSDIKNLWSNVGETKGTTTSKIATKKHDLQKTGAMHKLLNKKISKIANKIRKAEKENRSLSKTLKNLSQDKKKNEQKRISTNKKIDKIKKHIASIDKVVQKQQSNFEHLLINQFSMIVAMDKMQKTSINNIVMKEIYNTYKVQNIEGLNKLKRKIEENQKRKAKALALQNNLEQSISSITKKRELYLKKRAKKKELLNILSKDEKAYRRNISNIIRKQNSIQSKLAELNIIRKDEIKKAKDAERARVAEMKRIAEQRAREREEPEHVRAKSFANDQGIKRYGSSYHKDRTYKYRGNKTISPLKGARVVKNFGTYIDPIYKMKIFNDSITLKAPKKNAKVRNVLNGKVVFAGQNSMMGKVVIISHGNKLHTIYAGLSKISPIVKSGYKVKKGNVIGKVKSKLIFEATKDSKYINPRRLIKL